MSLSLPFSTPISHSCTIATIEQAIKNEDIDFFDHLFNDEKKQRMLSYVLTFVFTKTSPIFLTQLITNKNVLKALNHLILTDTCFYPFLIAQLKDSAPEKIQQLKKAESAKITKESFYPYITSGNRFAFFSSIDINTKKTQNNNETEPTINAYTVLLNYLIYSYQQHHDFTRLITHILSSITHNQLVKEMLPRLAEYSDNQTTSPLTPNNIKDTDKQETLDDFYHSFLYSLNSFDEICYYNALLLRVEPLFATSTKFIALERITTNLSSYLTATDILNNPIEEEVNMLYFLTAYLEKTSKNSDIEAFFNTKQFLAINRILSTLTEAKKTQLLRSDQSNIFFINHFDQFFAQLLNKFKSHHKTSYRNALLMLPDGMTHLLELWLKLALKKSNFSLVNYLKVCPEWQKSTVMTLVC